MKTANLGDYLFWRGQLGKIIATCQYPTVVIELQENERCPHCNGDLGKKQIDVVPTSPLFQEDAQPVPTIQQK